MFFCFFFSYTTNNNSVCGHHKYNHNKTNTLCTVELDDSYWMLLVCAGAAKLRTECCTCSERGSYVEGCKRFMVAVICCNGII